MEFNEAGLYKLAWNLIKKDRHWANFLQARFMHSDRPIRYYKSSSIWPGITSVLPVLQLDLTWALGYNSSCRLWFDNWTTGPLIDKGPITLELMGMKDSTSGSYIQNFRLVLLSIIAIYIQEAGLEIYDISFSSAYEKDELI